VRLKARYQALVSGTTYAHGGTQGGRGKHQEDHQSGLCQLESQLLDNQTRMRRLPPLLAPPPEDIRRRMPYVQPTAPIGAVSLDQTRPSRSRLRQTLGINSDLQVTGVQQANGEHVPDMTTAYRFSTATHIGDPCRLRLQPFEVMIQGYHGRQIQYMSSSCRRPDLAVHTASISTSHQPQSMSRRTMAIR